MSNKTFSQIKTYVLDSIEIIKSSDLERGGYLERHIIFDDRDETIKYTGEPEIIHAILNKTIIDE